MISSFSFYYISSDSDIILNNNNNDTKIFESVDFITFVKMLINNFNEKIQSVEKSDNFNVQKTSFENSEQRIKRDFSYVIINNNILFNIHNADDDARERQ